MDTALALLTDDDPTDRGLAWLPEPRGPRARPTSPTDPGRRAAPARPETAAWHAATIAAALGGTSLRDRYGDTLDRLCGHCLVDQGRPCRERSGAPRAEPHATR